MKALVMRILPVIIVTLLSTGCAAVKGYPDLSTNVVAEITSLEQYLKPDVIKKYESPTDTDRNNLSKRTWRNEVVNARLHVANLYFNKFQQEIFEQGVGFGIATDWTVLALNAAGTLAGGGTPNVLSAGSAAIVGGKAAFDKNAYFDKTMPALLATMSAKRKDILVRIRVGLTKEIEEYPLTLALSDLEDYYHAGTIPGATVDIAENAGAIAKKAEAKLESLMIVVPVPADLQVRLETASAYIKTLTPSQMDELAKSLGVRTGGEALSDILTTIAKIQSVNELTRIAQKIKILFGKEL